MHDPSRIIKCEGKYYVYSTGNKLPMRFSDDLIHWKRGQSVLSAVPEWAHRAVPDAKNETVWAPDIIFFAGKYHLFYSFSTFGSRTSTIGFLTSPTLNPDDPQYAWTDGGLVINTNPQSKFNAIDPALLIDKSGELWMTFGSWNEGGIQLVHLDKNCKPVGDTITVATGQAKGPEAPYLYFRDGYYYLFENEGNCCAGVNSSYQIMIGRSKSITGPYFDKEGRDLAKGGGTLFLGNQGREIGPGHLSIITEGGIDRFSYHFYDGERRGTPTLGLQTLTWDADGWPRVMPSPIPKP